MRESRARCASSGAHNLPVDKSRRDGTSHALRRRGKKTKTRGRASLPKGRYLFDDIVEVAVGEDLLDLLFKPLVGGPVRDVNVVSLPGAGEQGDNTACPIENDSTGISWGGKGLRCLS